MIQPTEEQLALLSPPEQAAWRLADFWARNMRWQQDLWNSTFMVGVTWLTVARRLRVQGLENVNKLDFKRGVLLLSNHRSFFDFFAISCVLFYQTDITRRLMFPVRSTFFYSNPIGSGINMLMSGMAMFPPILRESERKDWNQYATQRCVQELQENGVVIGIHPEGTRGKGPDPFELQRGKPGAAQIALEAPDAQVLPIFITGLSNSMFEEFRRNWTDPGSYPIFVSFGEELNFDDLRTQANDPTAVRQATQRTMDALTRLAEEARRRVAEVVQQAVA